MIAHGPVPPPLSPLNLLTQWRPDPVAIAAIVAAGALYWRGLRAVKTGPPFPRGRVAAFFGGLAVVALALLSPIDAYADAKFSLHMVQHVLLLFVAAPLFALSAPVTLALRAVSPNTRRRILLPVLHSRPVRFFSNPVVAWLTFAVVQYVTHFTPLYNAALENDAVHAAEHALYLAAGLVFWWPVVALDPAPRRVSHPVRILYLVLAMPLEAFLGVAILSAGSVLYAHYRTLPAPFGGAAALADQSNAGAVMWMTGDVVVLVAGLLVARAWMRHDEMRQARLEADLDSERLEAAGR